jgi:formyltetrahydrofolate deformylase
MTRPPPRKRMYTLKIACPDRVGIVAAVSQFLASNNGWIFKADHHADDVSKWFFMRHEIIADSLPFSIETFRDRFSAIAESFHMKWHISDSTQRKRVVVLVSKHDHCLSDLLYRWRNQDIEFDIACVISNHEDLRKFVEWHEIPYFKVDVTPENKVRAFNEIERLYLEHRGETMVLARFMQVLPSAMCEKYPAQIINIHHSFLPSFVGAKPYHQAFEKGVKLVGATCHYVNADLDAGPIIDQDVIRVGHGDSVDDMVRQGRDVEKMVLARGLRYHVEDRVLIHQNKTVVFK